MSDSKVRRLIVGDHTYLLEGGSTFENLFEWEAYVMGLRENPFDALAALPAGTDVEVQKEVASRALERWARPMFVGDLEAARFEASPRGQAWALWSVLQAHHAVEFPTVEEAARLLAKMVEASRDETADQADPHAAEDDPVATSC